MTPARATGWTRSAVRNSLTPGRPQGCRVDAQKAQDAPVPRGDPRLLFRYAVPGGMRQCARHTRQPGGGWRHPASCHGLAWKHTCETMSCRCGGGRECGRRHVRNTPACRAAASQSCCCRIPFACRCRYRPGFRIRANAVRSCLGAWRRIPQVAGSALSSRAGTLPRHRNRRLFRLARGFDILLVNWPDVGGLRDAAA